MFFKKKLPLAPNLSIGCEVRKMMHDALSIETRKNLVVDGICAADKKGAREFSGLRPVLPTDSDIIIPWLEAHGYQARVGYTDEHVHRLIVRW